MIAAAASEGHSVTARSLELWRYRGLLPRPRRQAGGRALWLYPAETELQLARLLYWRTRTRSHDEILLVLWVEGFPIELGRVQAALSAFLARWTKMIAQETEGSGEEGEAALVDSLARKLARMRGKAPLPHLVRMRLNDRERAYGYMVATMFGMRPRSVAARTTCPIWSGCSACEPGAKAVSRPHLADRSGRPGRANSDPRRGPLFSRESDERGV